MRIPLETEPRKRRHSFEKIYRLVEGIPAGNVASYGAVAEAYCGQPTRSAPGRLGLKRPIGRTRASSSVVEGDQLTRAHQQ